MKYLISACLVGENVRYDGKNCYAPALKQLVATQQAMIICPEVAGGLSTPRLPAEIIGGDGIDVLNGRAQVRDSAGNDQSKAFIDGAYQALKLAQAHQVTHVVLKANSPSCGTHKIYDGSFSGIQTVGQGVTAALLTQHGFQVIDENQFLQLLAQEDSMF